MQLLLCEWMAFSTEMCYTDEKQYVRKRYEYHWHFCDL